MLILLLPDAGTLGTWCWNSWYLELVLSHLVAETLAFGCLNSRIWLLILSLLVASTLVSLLNLLADLFQMLTDLIKSKGILGAGSFVLVLIL